MQRAKDSKQDEFYTRLPDIEDELVHYRDQFRGKVVLCNCDDPYESNFFKYFALNFNFLGLKKLIATCYDGSPFVGTQFSIFDFLDSEKTSKKTAFKIEITEVKDFSGKGTTDLSDVQYLLKNNKNCLTKLNGNGDFRSKECIDLLKECDIVVTNPPFSLFREFVDQLITFNKKFLIIGNKNAITYKEIFKLIQNNKLWIGYRSINKDMWFVVPDGYKYEKEANGLHLKHIMSCWFTNLNTTKRHESLILYAKYNPEKYPKYDNFDAINVDQVNEIPCDYYESMGVPITFLDKYNPDQFEIIRFRKGDDGKDLVYTRERESNTLLQNCHSSQKQRLISYMLSLGFKESELDYCNGLMGVPITFLDKYNPEEFQIMGTSSTLAKRFALDGKIKSGRFYLNGERKYDRVVIRRT